MKTLKTTFAVALLGASMVAMPARAVEIVVTGWGALMTGGPVAVALERGDFKKHGADITGVQSSSGGATTLRNMFGGNLPYAEVSTAAAIAAFNDGADVRIISSSIRTLEDLFWVTMPDNPAKTIKDLVGKRIGFTRPKSISETVAKMAVQAAGIPLDKVTFVSLGGVGSGLSAMERGGADAMLINEPLYSARQGKYRIVFDLSNLPKMTQTVGVTTLEWMKKDPALIRAILAAKRDAVDFVYANPEAAGKLIAKRYGDTLKEDVSIRAVKHLVQVKYWSPGNMEIAGFEAMAQGLRDSDSLKGPVDWNKLIDKSFLPKDLQN